MEITVTIIDPTLYTKPWNALDKYPMRLQTDSFDIREMVCSESEAAQYNKEICEQTAEQETIAPPISSPRYICFASGCPGPHSADGKEIFHNVWLGATKVTPTSRDPSCAVPR